MLLTRLWSEGGNGKRRGKGGVETPDTSLVRRNQINKGREKERKQGGGVWKPLTRLWSEETKQNRREEEQREEKGGGRGGRLSSLTRL